MPTPEQVHAPNATTQPNERHVRFTLPAGHQDKPETSQQDDPIAHLLAALDTAIPQEELERRAEQSAQKQEQAHLDAVEFSKTLDNDEPSPPPQISQRLLDYFKDWKPDSDSPLSDMAGSLSSSSNFSEEGTLSPLTRSTEFTIFDPFEETTPPPPSRPNTAEPLGSLSTKLLPSQSQQPHHRQPTISSLLKQKGETGWAEALERPRFRQTVKEAGGFAAALEANKGRSSFCRG